MYRIEPLFDRVLVRRKVEAGGFEEQEDGTMFHQESGLFVPGETHERRPEAEVVAIGFGVPEAFKERIKVGDNVLLGQYTGETYNDHMLVMADEILAKLHEVGAEDEDGPGVVGFFDRKRAKEASNAAQLNIAGGESEPLDSEEGSE